MADLTPLIETLENRWMRAWIARDHKDLKSLTARDFILLVGGKKAVILDRRSWLEAAGERWRCSGFRYGDVYVQRFGGVALFAAQLEIDATMDGREWPSQLWVTDLWRKRRIGGWRMVERVLSRIEDDPGIPAAIKSLQLWR